MFYLLHGDDGYAQKETLGKLQAKLGDPQYLSLNTTKLDGKTSSSADLEYACNTMPFLSAKRLVIVSDFLVHQGGQKEVIKAFVEYLGRLPETTALVLLESKPVRETHAVIKWAEGVGKQHAYIKQLDRPQGAALDKWIVQQVTERGGKIVPQAAHELGINVGNDLQTLSNEIEKLVLYCGDEMIRSADVVLMSPYSAEASVFDLVDALGGRNGKKAMSLLHQQLTDGTEPFYLFSMIARQFRLLIQVAEGRTQQMTPQQIASAVGIHPFVAKKLSQQSESFNLSQLEKIYSHLLDIDVEVKTGKQEITTALNLLVATLAY